MKKKIFLILGILAIVLVIGALIYLNHPKVVARNALAGVASDLLSRDEIKPLVKMSQKGSLELSAEINTEEMYLPVYGDSYVGRRVHALFGGKLYCSKDSLFFKDVYTDLAVPREGIDFDLHADLYMGSDYLYITEEKLLGGTVGMIRGEMADALKNSELSPEIPAELYAELMPAMKSYDRLTDKQRRKDEKLLRGYLGSLLFSVEKQAVYEKETREVLLQGDSVRSRVITASLDREGIIAVLRPLLEQMRDDGELRSLINRNRGSIQGVLKTFGWIQEDTEIEDLYDWLLSVIQSEIESQESAETDRTWVLEVVTPRFTSTLRALRLYAEDGSGREEIFFLELGEKGIKKTDQVRLFLGKLCYDFTIAEIGADGCEARLVRSLEDASEETLLFSLAVDKAAQTFELYCLGSGPPIHLSGDWIETSKGTAITAKRFWDSRGNLIENGFEIRLVITPKDPMPRAVKKSEVKNLFDLTLDEVEEIITDSMGLIKFFI